MGLFDKKYCDICGEKIGLLGNRKLSDGNMCKDCARLLSPWFSERKQSTVEEIKGQLAYREANRDIVRTFHASRSYGEGTKLLIDDSQGLFLIARTNSLVDENPDVVALRDIISVSGGCDEHRLQHHDPNEQPGQPPRYEYSYDFKIVINVNHPYFDDIRFNLNRSSIKTGEVRPGDPIPMTGMNGAGPRPGAGIVHAAPSAGPRPGAPVTAAGPRPGAPGRPAMAGPRPGTPTPGGRPNTVAGPRPGVAAGPRPGAPAPGRPQPAPAPTAPMPPHVDFRGMEEYEVYSQMMAEVVNALTPGVGWQ